MQRNNKYVALDVHQATTVASVRIEGGKVINRSILPTESAALLEFFGSMRGSVRVAFEEGTQAQWLYDLLTPVVDHVTVCDRHGEHRGNKGDQQDADLLSHRLLCGDLRSVYHGSEKLRDLQDLTRTYVTLMEDSTRTMLRIKALFRARAIAVKGTRVYGLADRNEWLGKLKDLGVQLRAETLYAQLDTVRRLRPRVKATMIAHAQREPAFGTLCSIPFVGPVRAALLIATMKTPWRFRTKRNLWAYSGLAVVTQSSADHEFVSGRAVRRTRKPLTRGLNKNHNRILKNVFKGMATAAKSRDGELREFYNAMVARGMREEMASVTLARKLAAITLRLWKRGEPYDSTKLVVRS
jgi:transposase